MWSFMWQTDGSAMLGGVFFWFVFCFLQVTDVWCLNWRLFQHLHSSHLLCGYWLSVNIIYQRDSFNKSMPNYKHKECKQMADMEYGGGGLLYEFNEMVTKTHVEM